MKSDGAGRPSSLFKGRLMSRTLLVRRKQKIIDFDNCESRLETVYSVEQSEGKNSSLQLLAVCINLRF